VTKDYRTNFQILSSADMVKISKVLIILATFLSMTDGFTLPILKDNDYSETKDVKQREVQKKAADKYP
jgi:hypothetical protein